LRVAEKRKKKDDYMRCGKKRFIRLKNEFKIFMQTKNN